jgi:diguanylate cyclase (GGDEF)-like protein
MRGYLTMAQKGMEILQFRKHLLTVIEWSLLILLAAILILEITVDPAGSSSRNLYTGIIMSCIILNVLALVSIQRGSYTISAALIALIAFLGPWASFALDPAVGVHDLFPLVYLTISVILASLFLSVKITAVLAVVQFSALVLIVIFSADKRMVNWASFLAYVFTVFVLSIIAGITIHKQMESLRDSTFRDHLTGVHNRLFFDKKLGELSSSISLEKGKHIGLIMLDIDNFKQLNDIGGHIAGDRVLQQIAQLLKQTFDAKNTICRFGGDEFAVILHAADKDEALKSANKLTEAAALIQAETAVSISVGMAFSEPEFDPESLLHDADTALLKAKQEGKNRVSSIEHRSHRS